VFNTEYSTLVYWHATKHVKCIDRLSSGLLVHPFRTLLLASEASH
jgi:hypothetical protein